MPISFLSGMKSRRRIYSKVAQEKGILVRYFNKPASATG